MVPSTPPQEGNCWRSCKTGHAKITKGYRLPAKFVIHTVGPVWCGGDYNEEKLLESCYKQSLALAKEHRIDSVAFPLISAGAYGYPKDKALKVATAAISEFLLENEMDITIVVYSKESVVLSEKLFAEIEKFIEDNEVNEDHLRRRRGEENCAGLSLHNIDTELSNILNNKQEIFSQMLLRLIDECNKTDVEIYKKANKDRKLFSKIRSDAEYQPSKETVLAFALALELDLHQTKKLLKSAGFVKKQQA